MAVGLGRAQADIVQQLNITGGAVDLDLGVLGSVGGSFATDGTLVMGIFQPPPSIFPSVTIGGHTLTFVTDDGGGLLSPPAAQVTDTTITADLSSLFLMLTGPLINGNLNVGGVANGTYDPETGEFHLSWTTVLQVTSAEMSLDGTVDVSPVPLPPAAALFALGLAALRIGPRIGSGRAATA
jgi:hypothetical protein